MFLADLHLHSQFSDGSLTIPELVDLMGKHGMGAIAITDHLCENKTFLGKAARVLSKSLFKRNFQDYLNLINEEADRAWQQYRMLVIPGVEITKNSFSHKDSAHILAIDIHDYIDPDLPLREIIDAIHAQGGLAIAAHPVSTGKVEHQTFQLWEMREELKTLIDAWEVASGRVLFDEVHKSGLPAVANSDLHVPGQIESWKTSFAVEKTASAIKNAIVQQNLGFEYYSPAPASRPARSLKPIWTR
jgi:predicted metal-dependent phosphoesterase TrpH